MNAFAPAETDLNRRLEEMMADVEVEIREAVAYVDTVVIPDLRRESAGALRLLAAHLDRLADKIDPAKSGFAASDPSGAGFYGRTSL